MSICTSQFGASKLGTLKMDANCEKIVFPWKLFGSWMKGKEHTFK